MLKPTILTTLIRHKYSNNLFQDGSHTHPTTPSPTNMPSASSLNTASQTLRMPNKQNSSLAGSAFVSSSGSRRSVGSCMPADMATLQYQQQQQPPERKKKTTLLRKLSEKRAHKYEFLQHQQQQQQQQQHQFRQQQQQQQFTSSLTSSSSSSSSSLNNSFSQNRAPNVETGSLNKNVISAKNASEHASFSDSHLSSPFNKPTSRIG